MDILKVEKKLNCREHIKKEIEFVQINETLNQQENNIFQCMSCVNDNPFFKQSNYQLISQILEEGSSHIIKKWPPVNDYSIIAQLAKQVSSGNQAKSISNQIINYFSDLKHEILTKIDLCQKNIINQINESHLDNNQILKRYQEISRIVELKDLLSNKSKHSLEKQEEICSNFIQQVESDKQRNTELLQNLLSQTKRQQNVINFEYPDLIKKNILNQIDQISLINQHYSNESLNTNLLQMNNDKIDLIMKLVGNKSNFCSDQFLSSFKQQLNPLIQQLSIDNIFLQNKQPIRFQELTSQQLDVIQDYVNHTIQLKNNNNNNYLNEITNSYEKRQLEGLICNRVNYPSNNFIQQLERYLIDTYPFLKKINFTNAVTERHKFQYFKDLSEDILDDIFILVKKRQELEEINTFESSQTQQILKQQMIVLKQSFKEEDINRIFRKYPIFDLINQQIQQLNNYQIRDDPFIIQDIIQNIQLNQYKKNDAQIMITKNQKNLYEVYTDQNQFVYCVLNITLEKEKKYIFRFKAEIQKEDNQQFLIGLTYKNQGYTSSAAFYIQNNLIKENKQGNYIGKYLKGSKFSTPIDNLLEIRVFLKEQILEIVDYPNQIFKIGIFDEFKHELLNDSDYQLRFGVNNPNIKLILMNAFIVSKFQD